MFQRVIPALLAAALPLAAVHAEARVEVKSDVPARVFFDEEFVGSTPIVLDNIPPGSHKVWIEDSKTGEMKIYAVMSPKSVRVEKTIQASFNLSAGTRTATRTTPAQRAPRVWTTVSSPPPPMPRPAPAPTTSTRKPRRVVYTERRAPTRSGPTYTDVRPVSSPPPTARTRSRRERAKVHTRNTMLGLTAASQIFTKNKRDKKRYRNVGLGLTVLNEILR